MTAYLSRLRLSRAPSARALDVLLNPAEPGPRIDAHHRLLWAVFADDQDRKRDFLWRDEGGGLFLTLSARPPAASDLFDPPEVQPFAPVLATGDRLAFALRVNATRTEKTGGLSRNGKEQKRHIDVVMDALHPLPKGERAPARMAAASSAGTRWLAGQGERGGFRLLQADVADYSVMALPRHIGTRKGQPQFGILDMTGLLEVANPSVFAARLVQGFGRAKAFGCGLMLIRRAG